MAGQTEDKVEDSARVGWSGAGVNLRTTTVAPDRVRTAVERILRDPGYRIAAEAIGTAMRGADAEQALARVLDAVTGSWARTA